MRDVHWLIGDYAGPDRWCLPGSGVRLVRFLYCDNGGVIRGKATHIEGLARRMKEGMALNLALAAMNSLDQLQPVEEMGCVGELRLMPDPTIFTVLPYAPNTAAMFVDHVRLDGAPYEAGARKHRPTRPSSSGTTS